MINQEKVKYILEQYRDAPKEVVDIELDEEIYEQVVKSAEIMGVTINEFFELALAEKLIEIETEKYKGKYPNIIDVFDFYKLDELIESEKEYLVINPNGNHVMLLPIDVYNKYKSLIEE